MRLELLAQVADVGLQHPGVAAEVVVPDVVEDLRPGQDPPRVGHQVAEQPVLGVGQLDRRTVAEDLAGVVVELEVAEAEDALAAARVAEAPQDRADAGEQLLDREGLGDVVVAAEGEAADLVLGRVAGGEEEDRGLVGALAHPPGDLEAVEVGQHHVEQDEVGPELADRAERRLPVGRRLDLVVVEAQGDREDIGDVRLVVDDEDLADRGVVRGAVHAHIVSEVPVDFLGDGVANANASGPLSGNAEARPRAVPRSAAQPRRHETDRRDRHPRPQRGGRAGGERAPPPLLLRRGPPLVLPDRDRRQRERRPDAGDRRAPGRRTGGRRLPAALREGPRAGAPPGLVAQRRRGRSPIWTSTSRPGSRLCCRWSPRWSPGTRTWRSAPDWRAARGSSAARSAS